MVFDTASLIYTLVFGLCAGCICSAVTAKTLPGNGLFLTLMSVIVSVSGARVIPAAYPVVTVVLAGALILRGASGEDAAAAAITSAISSLVVLIFTNALFAPCLEAYSYTLNNAFYYSAVHDARVVAAAVIATAVLIPLLIWRRRSGGIGSNLAICVISLSLAAAAVMILHMCAGQIVDYNAKHFKLPLPYALLTGSVSLLCAALMCTLIRILKRIMRLPGKIGETKEFYLIIAAIICTVVFYCYENTIINNYTTFDDPRYKYTVSILIVMMIVTILGALLAVCSYILRTRREQSRMEKEMEITAMYKSEIQDMQREIFDFKHDYVKIYSSMSTFIINKEYDKLADFFNSNITPLQKQLFSMDEDSRPITLLNDEAVQGLLYSYIIKAKKHGVSILVDISEQIPESPVPVIDLNRILGIFLDNAIEHAVQTDKTVCFGAILRDDCIMYVVSNSAEGVDTERMFRRGESTKGSGRGRGLAIARKLCAAHDSLSMHTYSRNGRFTCEIYVDL